MRQDPDARIFVFLGRWVKQKGVDYIADVAEWMLSAHPKAQLVMIGPVGDCFGSYARAKLEALRDEGRFKESLFVYADFLIVPQELWVRPQGVEQLKGALWRKSGRGGRESAAGSGAFAPGLIGLWPPT